METGKSNIEPSGNPLPLRGIRVVAAEQAVSAPFCSRQLADMGADVVKIERPDGGDFARDYDHALGGVSSYFAWLNRGKRSVVLDLKNAREREICGKLIARADVFIHNLAPRAADKLGFHYEALSARSPRLIWCRISGYGDDGPYRDRKTYDLLAQAESGVMSLTGTPDAPAKTGVSIGDIAAGMYAYSSILAALMQREQSGAGQRIDISMLECLAEWVMPQLYFWLGTGTLPARAGLRHSMIVPYGAYSCADGQVLLGIQNDREWVSFCAHVLNREPLARDERFATNAERLRHRDELEGIIEDHFSRLTRSDLVRCLEKAGIASGVLNDLTAVAAHPQLKSRRRWAEVPSPAGKIPALLPPHNLACAPPVMGAVPGLGEHTGEVLAEAGAEEENPQ